MTASLKASADGLSASLQVGGVDQATFGAGIQLSHRNRIINGAFQINQRVVSGTVTLTAGQYGHDRWKAGASGCTYTFATSGGLTTLTISAGSLQQVIEDVNVPFGTNTLCMSWSGTAQGKIAAGSYATSGVTASVTGGSNLTVEFGTGTLTKVQLEVGPSATPFEQRPFSEELSRCQRYYRTLRNGAYGDTNAVTQVSIGVSFADMRVAPTAAMLVTDPSFYEAIVGSTSTASGASIAFSSISSNNVSLVIGGFSALTAGRSGYITTDNFASLSAEL